MSFRVAARHAFGDFRLDIAFDSPADGVTALFGPSGAGKSATLAIIAGTIRPAEAFVALDGRVLTDTAGGRFVAPERRRIGIVHQDARLFPHMNVARNLSYGWRRAPGERRIGFDEVVAVLAIAPLLDRRPHDLSGGERQRVAIGRALLSQPELLLLDEPVSALDAERRADILDFMTALKTRFALPMLYVSHRADEVRQLADHVVRIDAGRVVVAGTPSDVLPHRAVTGKILSSAADTTTLRLDGTAAPPAGQHVTLSW